MLFRSSILDAVDLVNPLDPNSAQDSSVSSLPRANITGRSVTLTAGEFGGIGVSGNDLDINSSYFGTGTLTIGGSGQNAFIIETAGDLGLNTLRVGNLDPNAQVHTAYLAAPNGRILNRAAAGTTNVVSGKVWLFAASHVGEANAPITTQASHIEGRSIAGNLAIDNTGAVEVGGVTSDGSSRRVDRDGCPYSARCEGAVA